MPSMYVAGNQEMAWGELVGESRERPLTGLTTLDGILEQLCERFDVRDTYARM